MSDLITRGVVRLHVISAKLRHDRRGVTALEYGLVAAAVVATVMVGFTAMANKLSAQFNTIGTGL